LGALYLLGTFLTVWMAVDAVRRGRSFYWLWIMILFNPLGAVIYFFAEYLDGSPLARWTRQALPGVTAADLRRAEADVNRLDNAATWLAYATALRARGQHAKAVEAAQKAVDRAPAGVSRVSRIRAAFLLGQPKSREPGAGLKPALVRGGWLQLRVPEAWAEEYPDADSAAFSDRRGGGRVLRVVTATLPCPAAELGAALRARAEEPTTLEALAPGDLLLKSLSTARGANGDAVGFRWVRGRAVAAARARIATFTLEVPFADAGDVVTRDEVARVEHEVRAAEMSDQ
jgi:hypothetical protein